MDGMGGPRRSRQFRGIPHSWGLRGYLAAVGKSGTVCQVTCLLKRVVEMVHGTGGGADAKGTAVTGYRGPPEHL